MQTYSQEDGAHKKSPPVFRHRPTAFCQSIAAALYALPGNTFFCQWLANAFLHIFFYKKQFFTH
jgi:hypothetical protein